MSETEETPRQDDSPRGNDDRRGTVDPATSPVPNSPAPDPQALEQAEETLERVKPY